MIPIPNPAEIPIEYQLTITGRQAYARNANDQANIAQERFLLHNQHGMLIFASDLDLQVLHNSEFWIADGTFEMRPRIFAQIYTIHAFVNNEGMVLKIFITKLTKKILITSITAVVCCYGLLPNKSRQVYETFFTVVRNKIVELHGDQGLLRFIILDFEAAAHLAARNTFPNASTKGIKTLHIIK